MSFKKLKKKKKTLLVMDGSVFCTKKNLSWQLLGKYVSFTGYFALMAIARQINEGYD
jgi:hypothetical protein